MKPTPWLTERHGYDPTSHENGYLVDTPGFSSVSLDMDKLLLANGYKDFREADGSTWENNEV